MYDENTHEERRAVRVYSRSYYMNWLKCNVTCLVAVLVL